LNLIFNLFPLSGRLGIGAKNHILKFPLDYQPLGIASMGETVITLESSRV
jgi:hypothetical protein